MLAVSSPMSEVTQILCQIEQGDTQAADQLLPLVYDELRRLASQKLAHESPGQTLQATALVHEAYIRLVDGREAESWDNRRHFFAAAAESMRRILIERARRKQSLKHGGGHNRVDFAGVEPAVMPMACEDILGLDEAIQRLGKKDPRKAAACEAAFLRRPDHRGGRPSARRFRLNC